MCPLEKDITKKKDPEQDGLLREEERKELANNLKEGLWKERTGDILGTNSCKAEMLLEDHMHTSDLHHYMQK
jgi:hypothetical protein